MRLENKIKQQRAEVSKLAEMAKGKTIKDENRLKKKYKNIPISEALESAKQRLTALAVRLKRYVRQKESQNINRLFATESSRVYDLLKGEQQRLVQKDPPRRETEEFWKAIWEKEAVHNQHANWLNNLKSQYQEVLNQNPVTITKEDLIARVKRMKNWSAPGNHDMIHAYWLKSFTSLHDRMATHMETLVVSGEHPQWLTQDRSLDHENSSRWANS